MKKVIYGLIVALLGGVLGAGGMHAFNLFKPPAAAPSAAGQSGAVKGPDKAGEKRAEAKGGDATPGGMKPGEAKASDGKAGETKGGPGGSGAAGGAGGPGGGAMGVDMIQVEQALWPQTVTAVGSLRSDESVTVRAEQSGRIVALGFKEGQGVKAGQMLVQLDESVARAQLDQARANQKLAKAKFERTVELLGKGFVSGQAKDEAENALGVAAASVSLVEAQLKRLVVLAPFNGTAGLKSATVGDYVKDGQDIVNLEKTDPIKVDFKIPEVFLSKVRVGQKLNVVLDAMPGSTFQGTVYAINPQLDAAGRAVVVRAQMPNRNGALKPGLFARVRLVLDGASEVLVVPEQAVFGQGEDFFLYRVVEGRAQRTKVEIGQRRDGKAQITSGVAMAETIVLAGWQKLRDGQLVRVAGGQPGVGKDAAKAGAGADKMSAKEGAKDGKGAGQGERKGEGRKGPPPS